MKIDGAYKGDFDGVYKGDVIFCLYLLDLVLVSSRFISGQPKKPNPWASVHRFTLIVLVYGGRSANQHETYEAVSLSIDCGLSMMFILKQSVNVHPKWSSSMGGIA